MTSANMRIELRAACVACAVALAWPALAGNATVITGEVQAVDAQPIYTPESNSSPVVIRYFIPEGTQGQSTGFGKCRKLLGVRAQRQPDEVALGFGDGPTHLT